MVIALVILRFNHASVTTVGILVGIVLLIASAPGVRARGARPSLAMASAVFAVLLLVEGILALIHPHHTFAALADILGCVFLVIGAFWIAQAFI